MRSRIAIDIIAGSMVLASLWIDDQTIKLIAAMMLILTVVQLVLQRLISDVQADIITDATGQDPRR